MADYGNLSDEEVQAILDSIRDPSDLADLQDQLQQSRRLKNTQTPDTIDSGHLLIPNVAGMLGGMIDRYQGGQDEKAALAKRDDVYKRQSASNAAFLRALQDRYATEKLPGQPSTIGDNSGNYSI